MPPSKEGYFDCTYFIMVLFPLSIGVEFSGDEGWQMKIFVPKVFTSDKL